MLNEEKPLILETQYLPSLEYFILLHQHNAVWIEGHEYYERQTYRNRATILLSNGVRDITVPVKNGRKKILTKDIKIDNVQNWKKNHWRSIQSAYGKAPFFEYYAHGFESLIMKEYTFLIDLNTDLLSYCFQLLSWSRKINKSERYIPNHDSDFQVFKSYICPKKPFSQRSLYRPIPYTQVFGSNFAPNMSIIDLLFCEGPSASKIIQHSAL